MQALAADEEPRAVRLFRTGGRRRGLQADELRARAQMQFDVALQEQLVDAMSPRRDDDTPAASGGRLVDLPLQRRSDIRRQRRRRNDDKRP